MTPNTENSPQPQANAPSSARLRYFFSLNRWRENRPDRHQPEHIEMLGVRVSCLTQAGAIEAITAESDTCRIVNFANAHCLNTAHIRPDYQSALQSSDLVLPDGSGLALASRLRGLQVRENLNGTDLFPAICEHAAEQGLSLYLLGARPGIAKSVAENMSQRYPSLRIAGTRDGYFSEQQTAAVVDAINASGADLVFVAMGVPQQELWLQDHAGKLQARCALGVGGLFDFYAGRIARAPLWIRKIGMEWSWRLAMEPKRMWRRYIIGNPLFLYRAWQEQRSSERAASSNPRLRRLGIRLRRAMLASRHRWQARAIRALDIITAAGALSVLALPMALIALLIRLESPGPIFFSQLRIGRDGQAFKFWKFRSMYIDAEARRQQLMAQNEMQGGVLFKMKKDPRITRIGRFIRRYSIDELPQLWNVLRGDMALVGPRPPLPDEVAQYSMADRARLRGQPGITCVWQVSGRSEIPFEQQVQMDVRYLHDANLSTNIRLLAKTVPAVIGGRGAY